MPTLVIKSVSAGLHAQLKRTAAANRRSLTQETIHLLEKALASELSTAPAGLRPGQSYWDRRPLLPAFAAALAAGAFSSSQDSAVAISAERDAR